MSNVFYLCDRCASSIINDDTTWADMYDEETADEYRDNIGFFSDTHGYLVDAGMVPNHGVANCECCNEHYYGSHNVLETL